MKKLVLLSATLFLFSSGYSQTRIGTKGIDSIENVINQTFKNNKHFIDSGNLYNKDSSKVIGNYKKSYFINKIKGNLDFAQYRERLESSKSIYESFYYSNSKPMTAYRITVIPKNLTPEKRFLITGKTYLWEDHKLTLTTDKIKERAVNLLEESKNY